MNPAILAAITAANIAARNNQRRIEEERKRRDAETARKKAEAARRQAIQKQKEGSE
jgi:hypothetical protein